MILVISVHFDFPFFDDEETFSFLILDNYVVALLHTRFGRV